MPCGNFASILAVYELGVVCSPTYRRLSSLPGKRVGLVFRAGRETCGTRRTHPNCRRALGLARKQEILEAGLIGRAHPASVAIHFKNTSVIGQTPLVVILSGFLCFGWASGFEFGLHDAGEFSEGRGLRSLVG